MTYLIHNNNNLFVKANAQWAQVMSRLEIS